MKVISVAGQFQNGKDLIADYLASKLTYFSEEGNPKPWERTAYADAVKKVFSYAFGKDLDFIEEWKVKASPPPGYQRTIRQSLQFIGDGFRTIYGPTWIEMCFKDIVLPTIISDGRYIDELQKVRDAGGINILVYRPGFLNDDHNGSEAQIRPRVEFFLHHGYEGAWITEEDRESFSGWSKEVDLIDYFLRNDGNVTQLFEKIDLGLLPYIEKRINQ